MKRGVLFLIILITIMSSFVFAFENSQEFYEAFEEADSSNQLRYPKEGENPAMTCLIQKSVKEWKDIDLSSNSDLCGEVTADDLQSKLVGTCSDPTSANNGCFFRDGDSFRPASARYHNTYFKTDEIKFFKEKSYVKKDYTSSNNYGEPEAVDINGCTAYKIESDSTTFQVACLKCNLAGELKDGKCECADGYLEIDGQCIRSNPLQECKESNTFEQNSDILFTLASKTNQISDIFNLRFQRIQDCQNLLVAKNKCLESDIPEVLDEKISSFDLIIEKNIEKNQDALGDPFFDFSILENEFNTCIDYFQSNTVKTDRCQYSLDLYRFKKNQNNVYEETIPFGFYYSCDDSFKKKIYDYFSLAQKLSFFHGKLLNEEYVFSYGPVEIFSDELDKYVTTLKNEYANYENLKQRALLELEQFDKDQPYTRILQGAEGDLFAKGSAIGGYAEGIEFLDDYYNRFVNYYNLDSESLNLVTCKSQKCIPIKASAVINLRIESLAKSS